MYIRSEQHEHKDDSEGDEEGPCLAREYIVHDLHIKRRVSGGMDLGEIGKMRTGASDNPWMKRAMSEPALIFGAWLKTYRPTKPVILAAEGFARAIDAPKAWKALNLSGRFAMVAG